MYGSGLPSSLALGPMMSAVSSKPSSDDCPDGVCIASVEVYCVGCDAVADAAKLWHCELLCPSCSESSEAPLGRSNIVFFWLPILAREPRRPSLMRDCRSTGLLGLLWSLVLVSKKALIARLRTVVMFFFDFNS